MKNKEIEELLKGMRDVSNTDGACMNLDRYLVKLLLSYIEQLEDKINWYENIDINKTIDKFRVEHNEEIKELHNKIEQLENNRDKAIDELSYMSTDAYVEDYDIRDKHWNLLMNILKGDSDE